MEDKLFHVMNSSELNNLVMLNLPDAHFSWDVCEILELEEGEYRLYTDIKKGGTPRTTPIIWPRTALLMLCDADHIPEGNYLIVAEEDGE